MDIATTGEDLTTVVQGILSTLSVSTTSSSGELTLLVSKVRALSTLQRVACEIPQRVLLESVFPALSAVLQTRAAGSTIRSQTLYCLVSLIIQCDIIQKQRRTFETFVTLLLDTLESKNVGDLGLKIAVEEGLRQLEVTYPTMLSEHMERIALVHPSSVRLLSAIMHNKLGYLLKQRRRRVIVTTNKRRTMNANPEFTLPASMSLSGCPMIVRAHDALPELLKLTAPQPEILTALLQSAATSPVVTTLIDVLLPLLPYQSTVSHDFVGVLRQNGRPLFGMLTGAQSGEAPFYPNSDAVIHMLLFGRHCVLSPHRIPQEHITTIFHACEKFVGPREGMHYGKGGLGLGYYANGDVDFPYPLLPIHAYLMSRRSSDQHLMQRGIRNFQKSIEHVQPSFLRLFDQLWVPSNPWEDFPSLQTKLGFLCEQAKVRPVCAKYVLASLTHMNYLFTSPTTATTTTPTCDLLLDVLTSLLDNVSVDVVKDTLSPWMVQILANTPRSVVHLLRVLMDFSTPTEERSQHPSASDSGTKSGYTRDESFSSKSFKAKDPEVQSESAATKITELGGLSNFSDNRGGFAPTVSRNVKLEVLAVAVAQELIQRAARDRWKGQAPARLSPSKVSVTGHKKSIALRETLATKGRSSLIQPTGFVRDDPLARIEVSLNLVPYMPIFEWCIETADVGQSFWDFLHMYCWRSSPTYSLGTSILTLIRTAIKKRDYALYARTLEAILTLLLKSFPDASFQQEAAALRTLVQRASTFVLKALLEDPSDVLSLFVVNETGRAAQQSIQTSVEPGLLRVTARPKPSAVVTDVASAPGPLSLMHYLQRLEEGGAPTTTTLRITVTMLPHSPFNRLMAVALHFLRTKGELDSVQAQHHTWNAKQKVSEAHTADVVHALAPLSSLRFPSVRSDKGSVEGELTIRPLVPIACDVYPVAVGSSCVVVTKDTQRPIVHTVLMPMGPLHLSLQDLAVPMPVVLQALGLPSHPQIVRALWDEMWRSDASRELRGLRVMKRDVYLEHVLPNLRSLTLDGGGSSSSDVFCFFPPRGHLIMKMEEGCGDMDTLSEVTVHIACDHVAVLSSVDDWFRTLTKS